MKKNVLIKTFLVSSMLLATTGSYAADGTINFTGAITASSCTSVPGGAVDGGTGDPSLSVTLPSVTAANIVNKGDIAGTTAFAIHLTGCKNITPGTPVNMRVNFYGVGDGDDQYVLKNTGGAMGVGIQLLKEDATSIIDINGGGNKADLLTLTDSDENYVLNFNAAYVNVSGNVPGEGTVASTATYIIEYN